MRNLFGPALKDLPDRSVFGPVTFREYLAKHDLPSKDTASTISVDSLEKLPTELRDSDTMILRLGSPKGKRQTEFVLVRLSDGLEDFFLLNERVFLGSEVEPFLPTVSWRQLYSFQILNRLSEAALLNLALASGLMNRALELDDGTAIPAAATGQSTFTFHFRPHDLIDVELAHNAGQVEIDALFVARRGGRESLFVIEAKVGSKIKSIAKHKLFYPVLALSCQTPADMPIVPVYMHVTRADDGLHYHITECTCLDVSSNPPSLADLRAISTKHLVLPSRPTVT